MDPEQRERIREKYARALRRGERFWPDSVLRDVVVSVALLVLLLGLAAFVGVPTGPPADPADASYVPRPEWYFLFLFQLLKWLPGSLEWVGVALVPCVAVIVFVFLPVLDRNPRRHYAQRRVALSAGAVIVGGMAVLTGVAAWEAPRAPDASPLRRSTASSLSGRIAHGRELFSLHCAECHGAEGHGGVLHGVEGLEGYTMKPLDGADEMYTRTDETLTLVVSYGQPDLGMQPFGRAYGGELGPGDIEALVTFMRYTWDDRVSLPPEAARATSLPVLAADETPTYVDYIRPLVRRYCLSCHRPGRKNNHYTMATREEILTSGDHAGRNVAAGDSTCYLLRVIQGRVVRDSTGRQIIGVMPPIRALQAEYVEGFRRWVMGGMPEKPGEQTRPVEGTPPGGPSRSAQPENAAGTD